MNQAVILLWVSATLSQPTTVDVSRRPTSAAQPSSRTAGSESAPTRAQRAALNAWAESRLLTLRSAARVERSQLPAYDVALVRRIEDLLEQSRVSAGSLDEALALEQLEAAETLIYAHAELPQAAFLLAEAAWQQAVLAEQHGHARLAQVHRLRASALEGPRARPYAAATEVRTPGAQLDSESTRSDKRIRVRGLAEQDTLYWDGERRTTHSFVTTPGEHHAQVVREGELSWAGFVMVHRRVSEVSIELAPPAPCTRSDLTPVTLENDRVTPRPGVRCPLWAVARPASGDGVDVALCKFERCGSLLNWTAGAGQPLVEPLHPAHPWRFPAWAGYVVAGVGAAAATSLVLWRSGAFDDPERTPPTWSFGGISE